MSTHTPSEKDHWKNSVSNEEVYFGKLPKGFPGNSAGKESACNSGDPSSISESGKSSGEGIGYPCSILGPAWWLSL